ncbi:3-oxoacyl-[acyl-carrier-protein] synthase, KASII [Desulfurella amilsii]|uniref:3-oxoacyl-[acyl-carrier-protein] synthase 2 n=1 Tax=Desulfurella amilsii TaxID=1562698 RepID=A0A1X4XZP7_9BACT|nr:beta-ketoacyl-ACP synthase II [Desulfurella amilsii]OSS43017.1 3-oxoacyl-[acyl-carrier-protein] synthase, KASII [Desulfurella amilsii]
MRKRVVVTGYGIISPIGLSAKESYKNAINGVSGIDKITKFDATNFEVKIAAEVKGFNPENYVEKKEVKKYDLFSLYALVAAQEAIENSGLDLEKLDLFRCGVSVGSGIGGLGTIEKYEQALMQRGYKGVSPFFIPTAVINMAGGNIAIKYRLKGPNYATVTACASATHAIGFAARNIIYGDADVMIAGGCESTITPLAIAGFQNMKALSTRNDEPQKASRPFDSKRDGFIVGEGAGILVLEEYEFAKKRNANILAELVGFGMSDDGYHITAPDPEGKGAIYAMQMALNDARLNPESIDYINAHGTSTYFNDKIETLSIKTVFKEHAYKLAVSSTKSMTGHLLGAAGGIEAVFSAMVIENSIIPPTINLEHPDPECDLFYVPNVSIEKKVNAVMSNSFGFGGANAVLVFKKFNE